MTEVVLPTAGGCMRPWIWPNGMLHIEPCTMTELRLGDIAVWFDGKTLISHRVVALDQGTLATRADSSAADDAPVQPNQLLGRAVRFSKGRISYRLEGPWFELLTLVGREPWARLLATLRWARDGLRR